MKSLLLAIALTLSAGLAHAASMTNADIIKMVQAQLDETIILTAIENSPAEFDTSADGLIQLSSAGVPKPVIGAMIKRGAAPVKPAAKKAAAAVSSETPQDAAGGEVMLPSEVIMMDGETNVAMRYINPQVRTAARGLGFGGVASYAVLRGPAASSRPKNRQPSFLVAVPNQAQPESYLTIASFVVRKNNSREVLIGGGYMSYSTGIHPDRVVAVVSEKAEDQSRAQKGFTIYRVTPRTALASGEYAVILYTGEVQAAVATWFTGTGNSYFDFGID
jgi:hypothetical protein